MDLPIELVMVSIALVAFAAGGCGSQEIQPGTSSEPEHAKAGVFQGRCHCGKIAYEVRGPITKCSKCSCPGCRRATGALEVPFVTVPPDQFRVTSGTPAVFRAANGEHCDANGSWHYCPDCGGPLYWGANDGKQIDIFAGTLDDTSLFQLADGA